MRVTRRWTLKTSPVRTGWWLAEIYDPAERRIVECMTFQAAEAARRWADEASSGLVRSTRLERNGSWWREE